MDLHCTGEALEAVLHFVRHIGWQNVRHHAAVEASQPHLEVFRLHLILRMGSLTGS